mmetsp:Transcript_539/g.2121  ORF Transcript_539/g.2121 Transcript_539/m.2121 type:complete len:279 (-) Transcript_539:552-1388(-)
MLASTCTAPRSTTAPGTLASSSALGTIPAPMTTTSAGSSEPSLSLTAPTRSGAASDGRMLAALAPMRKVTPLASCTARMAPPSSGPMARSNGSALLPTTVTEPIWRSSGSARSSSPAMLAATSMPTKPAPTTTTLPRGPASRAACRMALASPASLHTKAPSRLAPSMLGAPGPSEPSSRRARPPVATTREVKRTDPPSERRTWLPETSMSTAVRPSSSLTPRAVHHAGLRSAIRSRSDPMERFLESLVRSMWFSPGPSRAMMVMEPPKPPAVSSSTAP